MPFIQDRNWAEIIIARYASILSINNQLLDLKLKYSPFLRSGENIIIDNNDFNIDFGVFNVLSVSHDLTSFTTSVKVRSVKNPLLHLTV